MKNIIKTEVLQNTFAKPYFCFRGLAGVCFLGHLQCVFECCAYTAFRLKSVGSCV